MMENALSLAQPEPVQPTNASPDLMAHYQKLISAGKMLGAVRSGLDKLVAMQDTVTSEDVVREAGLLVAQGLEPLQMAGLLADMPEQPEMIAEWLQGHDQNVRQREAQLEQVTSQVRHEMGTSALRGLMAEHMMRSGPDAGI